MSRDLVEVTKGRNSIHAVKATCILMLLLQFGGSAVSKSLSMAEAPLEITKVASGLKVPWGISFISPCEFLVTERRGRLLHFNAKGDATSIKTGIDVYARGQGGLLDVLVATDYADSQTLFLSYSYSTDGKTAGTDVSSAVLSLEGKSLESVKRIFSANPRSRGGRHFGSRIVESAAGHLFIALGERGDRESAQDLSTHNGTVVRIHRDGMVPTDNPFVGISGSLEEIWSYGHRNPQGATLDLEGNLWISEHGAQGGDEINKIRKGMNYGWPVISYGRHYSGQKIGVGYAMDGMEQPELYWDPSIAPSGMAVYSGKLWPEWKGHLFVGSLKFDYISRIDPTEGLNEVERFESRETKRVRDVEEAPDGSIWFLSEGRGAVYRMAPAGFPISEAACAPRSR